MTVNESSLYLLEQQRTLFKSVMVSVYMTILMMISVPGNILIILVQQKTRRKSSTDYYIITMAVFDLLIGSVVSPMYILRNFNNTWTAVRGMLFCRLQVLMTIMATIASTLLLGAVSVDRYMLTCRFIASMGVTLRQRARLSGIGISVTSVAFSLFNMAIVGYDYNSDDCEYLEQYRVASYVVSVIMMLMFICVFSTIGVCYTRVSMWLRYRHKQREARRLNTTKTVYSENSHSSQTTKDLQVAKEKSQTDVRKETESKKKQESLGNVFTVQKTHLTIQNYGCDISQGECSLKSENSASAISRSSNSNVIRLSVSNKIAPEIVRRKKQEITSREEKTLNRITLMLFLISLVYISSYIITWAASFIRIPFGTKLDETTEGLLHIAQLFFLINSAVNPTIYFLMSTKFRTMVLNIIKC